MLKQDASNVEGIACLGAHFFYDGTPEIAMKFYRRILQMGVNKTELYVNLALCCFYCQQFDLAIGCLEHAHAIADDKIQSDLWYNTAHIALVLPLQHFFDPHSHWFRPTATSRWPNAVSESPVQQF